MLSQPEITEPSGLNSQLMLTGPKRFRVKNSTGSLSPDSISKVVVKETVSPIFGVVFETKMFSEKAFAGPAIIKRNKTNSVVTTANSRICIPPFCMLY